MLEEDANDRYIPNTIEVKTLDMTPQELFQQSLDTLVTSFPPDTEWTEEQTWGFAGGYIGIPHMLLQLSAMEVYTGLKVRGDSLRQWAQRYIDSKRGPATELPMKMCGLINEDMCHKAMRACLSGSESDVDVFLEEFVDVGAPITPGEEDEFDPEMMQGRAGALYRLRLVRHWAPHYSQKINRHIDCVAERLLEANGHGERSWRWKGSCFIGAVHGDIGNLTQLVLCKPELASTLEPHLERLLALQFDDGGWPMHSNREDQTETKFVQFCHGAPGFVFSLWALRPHFPRLTEAIDSAIAKAQSCIWEKGLLKKEPGLCHGILGNAL